MASCFKLSVLFATIFFADLVSAQRVGYVAVTNSPHTKKQRVIYLDGTAVVQFNFTKLPREYTLPAKSGSFQIYFVTDQPEGVMWYHDDDQKKAYLAIKDGYVLFSARPKSSDRESIHTVGRTEGVRFDDNTWHDLKIELQGRETTISVDGKYTTRFTIPNVPAQLLTQASVSIGGAQDVSAATAGRVRSNFKGGLGQMLFKTEVQDGLKTIRNEVSLIAEVETETPGVVIKEIDLGSSGILSLPTTPRPLKKINEVTIREEGVHFMLPETFEPKPRGSMSFSFQTVKPNSMLVFSSAPTGGKFLAAELYDGNLYLVNKFGKEATRTLLLSNAADGQPHKVSLGFGLRRVTATVDGKTTRTRLPLSDSLPQTLGPLYVGAYPEMERLPWHTWARNGFQGCIEDLKLNDTTVDFRPFIQNQQLYGKVDATCTAMPPQCSDTNPCVNGKCVTLWGGYLCDCKNTDYMGTRCDTPAWTGAYNGKNFNKLTFRPQQKFHTDDISFRFQTMAPNGLIFHTTANNEDSYMRAEFEDGSIKVSTNIDGQEEAVHAGKNLNDLKWHTVYIQRRAGHLKVYIDDKLDKEVILPNQNYHHLVDKVYVAGYDDARVENSHGESENYIGYLRNFYMGGYDILGEVGNSGEGKVYQDPNIPPLIFNDVTFPSYDSHVTLPSQGTRRTIENQLLFRTFDENGIILLGTGASGNLLLIELFFGRIIAKIRNPGKPPVDITTPDGYKYSDGRWHSVTMAKSVIDGDEQLVFSVDKLSSTHAYLGLDLIELDGPIYVGGAPESVLSNPQLRGFISSRNGFRGCLASFVMGGHIFGLHDIALRQGVSVLNSCQEIKSKCTQYTCKNGGVCKDNPNNGTTWCDCDKTARGGLLCDDEPLGYYFRSRGEPDEYGCMTYQYPPGSEKNNQQDEVIFGVMTDEKKAVLAKLASANLNDFIDIKLVNGYVVATYDTNGQGSPTTITNGDVMVSDGNYHVVQFLRMSDKAVLSVDAKPVQVSHLSNHDLFNRLGRINVGCLYKDGAIVKDTGFRGIVGGLYVNGDMILKDAVAGKNTQLAKDVVKAPHPFTLGPLKTTPKPNWITKAPPIKVVGTPQTVAPTAKAAVLPVIPANVGGGGIAFSGQPGGPIKTQLFPDGSGGTVLGPGAAAVLAGSPASAGFASLALIPSLPATGPRAGAVMGIILGIMALFSSLIWAFYLCKPGYCSCCAGGGGGASAPLIINEPPAEELKPFINGAPVSPISGSAPSGGFAATKASAFSTNTGSFPPADDQQPLIPSSGFGQNGKAAAPKLGENAQAGIIEEKDDDKPPLMVIEHEDFSQEIEQAKDLKAVIAAAPVAHSAPPIPSTNRPKSSCASPPPSASPTKGADDQQPRISGSSFGQKGNVPPATKTGKNAESGTDNDYDNISPMIIEIEGFGEATGMDTVDSVFMKDFSSANTKAFSTSHTMNTKSSSRYESSVTSNTMEETRSRLGTTVSGGGYSYAGQQMAGSSTQQLFSSYQADGTSSTADYDIATGVHPAYHSATLPVRGSGMTKGHSTSTLGSNYNYSMRNTRSLGGYSQAGYMGSLPQVIVTPGPMGEEIRVDCCLMTSDGHSVVTGSSLGPPQVWNMTNGELLRIMHGEILGSTFLDLVSQDSMLVGAINADLEVNNYSIPKGVHNYVFQIWDFTTGRALDMSSHETCSALAVMSDRSKVILGRTDTFGDGTNIIVWDLPANQPIKEMRYDAPVGSNDYISFIALSQNDRYVVGGYTNSLNNMAEFVVFDTTLTTFSVSDPLIMQMDADPEVTAMLPNDEVATGLRNGDLVIWGLHGNQGARNLISYNSSRAHAQEVKAVIRSNNNHYLVSASADKTLKVWDLRSERLLGTLTGHNDEVWCAAISDDNEVIVSGSRDGSIRLWKLRTAQEICAFNAGVDVFYITMSYDKGTIVALGDKHGSRKLIMLQVVRSKVKRRVLASYT